MRTVKRLFVPYRCLACRKVLALSSGGGFCADCRRFAEPYGEEDPSAVGSLGLYSLYHYHGAVAHVLKRLKDVSDPQATEFFAEEAVRVLGEKFSSNSWDGIAYVPRYKEAYTVTRELAVCLAKETGVPVLHQALYKKKNVRAQRSCRYRFERLQNVSGAYAVRQAEEVRGKRILLIDDVLTTGATVRACARVLTEAGAERVDVLTVARRVRRSLLADLSRETGEAAKPTLYAVPSAVMKRAVFRYRRYRKRKTGR